MKATWMVTIASCAVFTWAASALAASVTLDEMAEARRWVAAKLEGAEDPKWEGPVLLAFENYGPVHKNARGGRPLRIVDAEYTHGLYCHAKSRVLVRLPSAGEKFVAVVGVDSNYQTRPARGSVVFSVSLAGKQVFRSDVLVEGVPGVPLEVELGGATEFTLEVGDGGDGVSCDQADWADARVVLADGKTMRLDEMPMVGLQRGPYTTDPPFSFTYGGKPSAELLAGWKLDRNARGLDRGRTEHTLTWTDPETGLVVRCVAVEYHDFPTVEWTLHFQNAGATDTPILENVQAMDVRLARGPACEFLLHHLRGDSCTPDSYEPLETTLGPNAEERFAPGGGRPTNGEWPYYNVQWAAEGVVAVIGWPGQWATVFSRDEGNTLRIRGGQELVRMQLHPGEAIRTPLAVLQFYQGDRVRAQNIWRRWMIAHNLPRPGGELPPPMLSSCSGGFFPGLKCNEADELRFIDTFTRQGIQLDYWWMDAGWYPCDAWPRVGTWEVDRERFPHGLRAISERVHGQGTRLILWFEPERVAPGTWLYETHPEWLLGSDGGTKLLNLGNTEARRWLTDHVDKLITEQGIDLYRQDFNIDPLGYWRAADAADRQGITEIRHVEGYLAYWDELRRRHPDMLIDSCASGGRRNDLETMRRAVPLLRSDYQSFAADPSFALGNQCQTYGLSFWLPYFGTGVYYGEDELVYSVRSHMCPAFGFCGDVRREGIDWAKFRRLTDDWRKISPSFLGDFHPLTSYSLAEDDWIAWQFDRPEIGRGMVQAFRRRESPFYAGRFPLKALTPDAQYDVINLDLPGKTTLTGRELMETGLEILVRDRPGSAMIVYERVGPSDDPAVPPAGAANRLQQPGR